MRYRTWVRVLRVVTWNMLIVLDALGVIFRTRDGWSGHLTRFVAAKGCARAVDERD
jgi:hypothetical protein